MKREKMERGTFYHYYNRGNNRENLFREEANYRYFLELLKKYVTPVVEVYSYCLLPNHFHLVIKTKEENQLPEAVQTGKRKLSQAFSDLFNAYAKAYNKRFERRGSLFQKHPKHKEITENCYLREVILYVNTNSAHHHIAESEMYPQSSYCALIATGPTAIMRKEVLKLFGGLKAFEDRIADKDRRIDLSQQLLLENEDD